MTTWSATYLGSFRAPVPAALIPFSSPSPVSEMSTAVALVVLDPDQDHVGEVDLGGPGRVCDDLLQEPQEDRQHLHVRVAVVDDLAHEVVEPDEGGDVLAEQVEGVAA